MATKWHYDSAGFRRKDQYDYSGKNITQEKIKVIGSGRTDAGVHAINQVANFKTKSLIGVSNLLRGINSLLPKDIVVKELSEVDDGFHARYDAGSKVYSFNIYNSCIRSALYRNYSWNIYDPLNVNAMREAIILLKGTHDFSSFCGANDDASNHVRTVIDVSIETKGDHMISITIEANGFLRHMVRNIVGTLVDAGKGKLTSTEFFEIMECKDRTKAGMTAPPQGLFLKEVRY